MFAARIIHHCGSTKPGAIHLAIEVEFYVAVEKAMRKRGGWQGRSMLQEEVRQAVFSADIGKRYICMMEEADFQPYSTSDCLPLQLWCPP
jgi:hypothetical protein